jgi:hypothetical protein
MKIRDLPVRPDLSGGDDIVSKYMSERENIKTVEDLKSFVSRWKAVWDLNITNKRPITPEEKSLVDGTFDAESTLKCLMACTTRDGPGCAHVVEGCKSSCAGMHVALPWTFVVMTQIAHHYGAPEDIVLIQMCGGMDAYYEDP